MTFTVLKLQFVTTQKALIAQDNRLMRLLEKAEIFSELDGFVVVVENRDTLRTMVFADELTERLTADRTHYDRIFSGASPADFRRWALFYLSPNDLLVLKSKIEAHASLIGELAANPGIVQLLDGVNNRLASGIVSELFTGFLDHDSSDKTAPEDVRLLTSLLVAMKRSLDGSPGFLSPWRALFGEKGTGFEAEDGYNWTSDRRYLMISVAPQQGPDAPTARESLQALRRALADVKSRFPGMDAGVTGQKALDEDETEAASRGMVRATLLSLGGLAALLVCFWRGFRRPLIQLGALIAALSVTFGLTTLFIGHLNLLSVTFAPMLLGLGIDYGIHWFSRYMEEERQAGVPREAALAATMGKLGVTLLLAGFSAALSFLPLMLTGFKGLAELGLICAVGMVATTLTTLGLLPALIVLFDRRDPVDRANPVVVKERLFVRLTPRLSFLLGGLAVVAFGLSLAAGSNIRFDLNMLHLQSPRAESVMWEKRLIEDSKIASIHAALFAHSLEEVERKSRAVARLATVSGVESVLDVLPSNQAEKAALLRELRPAASALRSFSASSEPVDLARLDRVLGRIGFKMIGAESPPAEADPEIVEQMRQAGGLVRQIRDRLRQGEPVGTQRNLKTFEDRLMVDLNDKLELIRTGTHTKPMTIADIPRPVLDRFVRGDSLFLIKVLPVRQIWDPEALAAFVSDLKSIDPDATGDPVTLSVFTRAFRNACVLAAAYAVIFIFLFLFATLRSLPLTLAALLPLALGTVWTFGLMQLLDVSLNLANTIFLPLVVGAGVEYGIVMTRRWREDRGETTAIILPSATAKGVLLAGLTTTVGFGSLIISEHQGIKSLGLLTTFGSVAVLAAAIIFLPALLHLATLLFRAGDADGRHESVPGHKERQ